MITLALRLLTPADASAVLRIYSGASVAFLGRPAMTVHESEEYVAPVRHRTGSVSVSVAQYVFGVEVAGDLVGVVKLGRRPGGQGRVGYVLREDCWGRGYATQAVQQLITFAFVTVGLDSLGAKVHPDNVASGRVLEKAGFTPLGMRGRMITYRLAASTD
ncbi:GNAT family N-acetyltransferase [Streptomyces halstedii]|uniref:GNAT family N-acetyltransferase n=1 Tax=Streptomyces TaxID=1883 RepID=UPI00068B6172|nr:MULTISPECIES: GNAT family N-acetyltransferase [Streptomyces]MYR74411.1 GNAT family N-acetyltransferase [Streptomyces sp. SID4925]SBV03810.1 ribosomal-protein-alanine N-acetyltransferase [Streptomyces sp. OspMP-M45]SCD40946.1 ribosomal-protein-alanine N-acetyltransferase [Streptomyces sp. PpalLS-921]